MQDPDFATPGPPDVSVIPTLHSSESMEHLCAGSVPCTGFSMTPVMMVYETANSDAAMESVSVEILVTMACEQGAVPMTVPLLAFESFVKMANDTLAGVRGGSRRVVGHVVEPDQWLNDVVDEAVAEFRRDLGLDSTDG
jgi:hypothetical protein